MCQDEDIESCFLGKTHLAKPKKNTRHTVPVAVNLRLELDFSHFLSSGLPSQKKGQ